MNKLIALAAVVLLHSGPAGAQDAEAVCREPPPTPPSAGQRSLEAPAKQAQATRMVRPASASASASASAPAAAPAAAAAVTPAPARAAPPAPVSERSLPPPPAPTRALAPSPSPAAGPAPAASPAAAAVTPAPVPAPAAVAPQGPATPAPAAHPQTRAGGLLPANTLDEARRDPRFQSAAVEGSARVKIVSVARGYPHFGISDNGCGPGRHFVTAELLAPFDGLPAGTPVVLRTGDGGPRAGATLALEGLRRAGKGRDGTFVYCDAAGAPPVAR